MEYKKFSDLPSVSTVSSGVYLPAVDPTENLAADRNKRIRVADFFDTYQGFTQSGTGAVSRSLTSKLRDVISVKDFGAVGDGVADDTAAIQAAVNAAMLTGKIVLIEGPGPYLISSKITVKITRDSVYPVYPGWPHDIHWDDITSAHILGVGMPTIKAIAPMTTMMELIFDSALVNLGPFYSHIEGIGFNGNNLATAGLRSDFTLHNTIERNRFWNLERGIEYNGFGVCTITKNVIKCKYGVYAPFGGGDSSVVSNDFYSPEGIESYCVYYGYNSGNLKIIGNTFTNDYLDAFNTFAIAINGGLAPGSETNRDNVIRDNEFAGYYSAIRIDGKSTSVRNVFRFLITGNHTINFSTYNSGQLLAARYADELFVSSNLCNSKSLSVATRAAIDLDDCRDCTVADNLFSNYNINAAQFNNCIGLELRQNTFKDCGKASTTQDIITFYGASSANNYVTDNSFWQSSASYSQEAVVETAGVDNTFAFRNTFNGVSTPYIKLGANSRFFREESGTAAPASGQWNQGDIVWNTAPTAGGVPGWVCVTTGTPGTWKAMAAVAV